MSIQAEALIIACSWSILLLLFFLNRFLLKDHLTRGSPVIYFQAIPRLENKPGSFLSRVGVLFVFMVNIITFFLVFAAALFPPFEQRLSPLEVNLPPWVNILGCVLFVIDYLWGFFALIYNPNYTPLTQGMLRRFTLATQGPYRIMRHPRYTSEAFLNIALFLFTGIWLPLVGVAGWAAIYFQGRAEEAYLLAIAEKEYSQYCRRTGMFFPRRLDRG